MISVSTYICQNTSQLWGNKKGANLKTTDLSLLVIPLVQNSNSLLEDLRRLNQLKDLANQTNTTSPKVDKPAPAHPQHSPKWEN